MLTDSSFTSEAHPSVEKILVLASARPGFVKEALSMVSAKYPRAYVTIVVREDHKVFYDSYDVCGDAYLVYKNQSLSSKAFSKGTLARIRHAGFGHCVIVYNNAKRVGYEAIERMVLDLRIPAVLGFDTGHHWTQQSPKEIKQKLGWTWSRLYDVLASLFLLILWGIECVVLFLPFLVGRYMTPRRIAFVTQYGYIHPTARIRAYGFADHLKLPSWSSKVVSLYDRGYKIDPHELRQCERIWVNLKVFNELLFTSRMIVGIKPHYAFFSLLALKKYFGKKLVFDMDDWDLSGEQLLFFQSRDVVEMMAKSADACLAASAPLKKLLEKWNARVWEVKTLPDLNRFSRVHEEVLDEKHERCEKHEKSVTFFWGGMIWDWDMLENLKHMIRSFCQARQVLAPSQHIILKIAAGGDQTALLEEYLQGEYSACGVQYLGWVPPDDMSALYRSVDVGLYILWHGQRDFFDAKSPTKLFEYMLMGKTIIASPSGEVNRIIRHGTNGLLVENDVALKEAMVLCARDPHFRHMLAQHAYRDAKKYYHVGCSVASLTEAVTSCFSKH